MKLTCEVQGGGEPIVLISGLAQVGKRWRRIVERLEAEYTVVTVDNRETGGTGACVEGFTITEMAQDVLDLMTELGHATFFLGGISMGGMIAQDVIRLAPDRVRAAVLLATAGGQSLYVPPPDPAVLMAPSPVELWTRLTGKAFAEANPEVIEEEAALSAEAATPIEGIMRQMQAIQGWEPGDALVGTTVPIAIAHGDADPLLPYENGVRLARKLGVELVTYEGSGHVLESERADDVADLMRKTFR